MKSPDKNVKDKKSKNKKPDFKSAVNFFAEAGLLKHVKRSGWWVAGIKDPESVAEHCFRCAVMGYYIAQLEGVDPYKVLLMTLFNDIHEARINDLHKMGHFYIDFKEAEKKVFADQIKPLDEKVNSEMAGIRRDYDGQLTAEAIVARDADILECLLQAREYFDNGHTKAKKFFKVAPDHLKTKTAKSLWETMKDWDSGEWWENVVKFER
ncbi:MAG: HD domain-containing protein [Candidatus Omnitrophica bacterium]|nr:HD domain-containing protein [Candidatus Omnitrophota bacterium]